MATISSTFKMQDQATKTFNSVASAMDSVIDKADVIANQPIGGNVSPALQEAIDKYLQLQHSQEEINGAVEKQAQEVLKAANNVDKIPPKQKNVESGIDKWTAKMLKFNQSIQFAKTILGGVGRMLNWSDELSLTQSRLNLINDGTQTTIDLQNKLYQAAQRSRGSYDDMAKSVSKLGLLAGDAFKNNDEMIAFSEMMNKSFKVSGAGQQEISAATYQLTQAMASGKLQGDEFRSIMENAPMLADAIAKYMGKSKGELRDLAAEGAITSDIIKNALFSAADDINAKYEQMPKTFGDAMNSIKNTAQRYLQPVGDKIAEMLNSQRFQNILTGILNGIRTFAGIALVILQGLGWGFDFLANHMYITIPLLGAIAAVLIGTYVPAAWAAVTALWAKATAWMAANSQMLLAIGIIAIVVGVLMALKTPLEIIVVVIGLLVAALAIWHIVQWAVNGALYACPLVWIIVLVIALIAAIFAFMQWMAKATGLAGSGLGMIAGGVNVVIQFFKNLGLEVANIGLGIWEVMKACATNIRVAFSNSIKNVQSFFYNLLSTALTVVEGICKALNKLPFVDFDYSGITSKAKEYANKAKEASDSKEDYESLTDAFNKGMDTFDAFGEGWVADAFTKGAAWGDNITNKISSAIGSFNPGNMMDDLLNNPMDQNKFGDFDMSKMMTPNGNVPVDIKKNSDKEVNISDEDLKMLKDIATREYMLNYKHITPNVNISFGDVRETADVGAVKDAIQKMMEDELAELYVVEEA
jgi:tape measure domain-containing protein